MFNQQMWHPSFPQQPLVATPHTISAPMAGLIAHAASYSALNPPEAARENLIPTTADSKFNLPQMLHNKINQHYYFKQLLTDYPTFDDILGVISEEVTHLDPLDPGKAKLPSPAFCCLYKLFLIKLDQRQLRLLLNHKKVYARGIGILYLRIVVDVKAIFDWIEPFLGDETEFSAAAESKRTTTFGEFVTQLFNEVLYCGQVKPVFCVYFDLSCFDIFIHLIPISCLFYRLFDESQGILHNKWR
jgi:pre-mRNA-splicing factor 38B